MKINSGNNPFVENAKMAAGTITKKRNVDIVFCIDGTGSMAPCIEKIKSNVRTFQADLVEEIIGQKCQVDSMRIKLIVFRDYGCDANAMEISDFYELPDDLADYEAALNYISAEGGGDLPENGLEALYYAMKSDFYTGPFDRQIICLFTDADALELGKRKEAANYPDDMVDMQGFIDTWNCVIPNSGQDSALKLRNRLKRMVIYAPADSKYVELRDKLDLVNFCPVKLEGGMSDIDFSSIVKSLANSVAA